ncbi:hypothetical protein FACS1894219_11470 [Clostridia bacterium]|nr:hypothetical protein FACS1894219_11470 [Clostridia bacterium]
MIFIAATWIKPLKIRSGKSARFTVGTVIDYVENPRKTDDGRLVTSYECNAKIVDEEFLLSKREYEQNTERNQGKHVVLVYHIRQSFKPGEVTSEEANEIGRQLALSFTKSRHAFVVATHTDRKHIHNHIILNSINLDCTKKFRNFWGSSKAIRRISDLLCAEHGLSVIENPKPSRESYGDWLGVNKPLSHRQILQCKIDEIVPVCETFDDIISKLKSEGFAVDESRKHITVKAPDWKKPIRLDSLGSNYTETAIRSRLGKVKVIASGGGNGTHMRVNILIDIQAKIREGKGAGYENWAKIFNLKTAAKTLIYLQENGIDSYDDLVHKSDFASDEFYSLTKKIKDTESRMKSISELQRQIGVYTKTRAVFSQYKASKWNRNFYDEHSSEIIQHRESKKYFDAQGFKGNLPSIASLKQDWATLESEKKSLYGGYRRLKDTSRELTVARANAERILGISAGSQNRDKFREKAKRDTQHL